MMIEAAVIDSIQMNYFYPLQISSTLVALPMYSLSIESSDAIILPTNLLIIIPLVTSAIPYSYLCFTPNIAIHLRLAKYESAISSIGLELIITFTPTTNSSDNLSSIYCNYLFLMAIKS